MQDPWWPWLSSGNLYQPDSIVKPDQTKLSGTFISLINMEAGINMEGGQNLQSDKCGGWNKRGGWKNYKCGGWKFYNDIYFFTVAIKRTVLKSINNMCPKNEKQ